MNALTLAFMKRVSDVAQTFDAQGLPRTDAAEVLLAFAVAALLKAGKRPDEVIVFMGKAAHVALKESQKGPLDL